MLLSYGNMVNFPYLDTHDYERLESLYDSAEQILMELMLLFR